MKKRYNVYTILVVFLLFDSATYFRLCDNGDKGGAEGGICSKRIYTKKIWSKRSCIRKKWI